MASAPSFAKLTPATAAAASHAPAEPEPLARDLHRDVQALCLAAITLMLLVSVVTRDPADPLGSPAWPIRVFYTPNATHYPPHDSITNACGYFGALVSGMLIDAIGISVALVVAACGGLSVALLSRGRVNAPVLRSLGGTIVVIAVSTAAGLSSWQPEGYPAVGAGGYLGAMTSTWLQMHFALPGAWILTLTTLTISLMMTTDYALWYAGWTVCRRGLLVVRQVRGGEASSAEPSGNGRRHSTDLDTPISLPVASGAPSAIDTAAILAANRGSGGPHEPGPNIRIRQRPKGAAADESTDLTTEGGGGASGSRKTADDLHADKLRGAVDSVVGNDGKSKLIAGVTAAAAGLAGLVASKGKPSRSSDEAAQGHVGNPQISPPAPDEGQVSKLKPQDLETEPLASTIDPPIRELDVNGETLTLRGDDAHEGPEPKIRMPKKRDELQAVIDAVNEELPDGAEAYHLPSIELLDESDDICYEDQTVEVRRKAKILEQTFKNFGFNIRVVEIETGPVIAQYEVELEAGLRLSKITGLADDLAIALRVPSVRIVAPIPGKNTVGIEVPNEQRQVVRLREVIEEGGNVTRKMNIPVFLGKDVSGNALTIDLAKMPHLLIAGRTGTGKSVCLNAIITSILMTCRPDEVRMLMIDPKMVELSGYGRLPHLMHPVVTDMKKAEAILAWAVDKMEERYSLLAKVGVRHINSYNDLGRDELYRRLEVDEADGASGVPEKLPFIVIIADEMADLMMTAGKEVETHIIRLAQKSRAVGIHLILATQKPTVDVITGLIKSNLPARLSFQVASRTDSRVVLDENGADKLLGNGDMLFLWPGTSTIMRGQGTYLSDAEIDRVVEHCSTGEQNFVGELMNLKVADESDDTPAVVAGGLKKRDELYESAIEVVIREGRGSVSLLQRCLGIGYGRAARLIDFMAEDGIVGEYNGAKVREVLLSMAEWERMQGIESNEDDESDAERTSLPGREDAF